MIIKQKLPAVTQNGMRWSTDKSVGLSFCFYMYIYTLFFSSPRLQARRKARRTFFISLIQETDCAVCGKTKTQCSSGTKIKQSEESQNFVSWGRGAALSPGWCVTVPHLCWPEQEELLAKEKTLKQPFSGTLLFIKGSTVSAVSAQHSSLLVTFQKMCWWHPYSWLWCLHIRQWEVSRVMLALLSWAPWLFLLLT